MLARLACLFTITSLLDVAAAFPTSFLHTKHKEIAPESEPKYGWVTLAFQRADTIEQWRRKQVLYQTYALASGVKNHSKYPLVLITDLSSFDDPDTFKQDMEKLGVVLHHMQELEMPPKLAAEARSPWTVAWNKLQMFNMTEYDRLVWLDNDALITDSMDYLFNLQGTWSQGDDWFCHGVPDGVCSGLVAFDPSTEMFNDILSFAASLDSLPGADQELIERYFTKVEKPVQLLWPRQAAFGKCADEKTTLPHFIHKPIGYDFCMKALSHLDANLSYTGHALDMCNQHKQGAMWRDTLCASHMQNDAPFTALCSSRKQ